MMGRYIIVTGRLGAVLSHSQSSHLIHSQVNTSIGNDPHQAGREASVQGSGPLPLQDLSAAVSHTPVLASAAQSQAGLQHLTPGNRSASHRWLLNNYV